MVKGEVVIAALTVGGLVLAVAIGLARKFASASRHPDKHREGADAVKVLGTTSLIAGLLVGFVLSGLSSSYTSAR